MHKSIVQTLKSLAFFLCFIASVQIYGQVQTISLNGLWDFKVDPYENGLSEGWQAAEYPTLNWDKMNVPGNWDIENEYADYAGTAWYRKKIEAPTNWQDKAVRLYFESVYNDVDVWLNGEKLGEHHLGFLPFYFDIGEKIKIGTTNTITLRVNNVFKRGAIWNWGGIRRPVHLEVTDRTRIEYQHITATPDLDKGAATINGTFRFKNFNDDAQALQYEWIISRENVTVWSSGKKQIRVSPDQEQDTQLITLLPKEEVFLWHFNHPYLYHSELVLYRNGEAIHKVTDRFGIRKVEVDGYQLKLNGEVIRPVGFNIVAEDRTTGNTLPLWRIKEDVDMLKELGCNMARLNHLPLPKAYLDYLDEVGIMTFEEVSLWGKDRMVDPEHPLPKYWLEKMIETKFNHPSVIGWSVGNEIGYLDRNPKVMEYVKGAIQHSKQLDPTRLAVYVSNSANSQATDPVEFSDLIMMNKYSNWEEAVKNTHKNHPGKPIFMSEFGKHLSKEDPNKGFIDVNAMMSAFQNKEYVVGVSYWTFNDYRSFWSGTPTWTTPPSQNRSWGIVNVFRQKKRAYHDFRKFYAPVKALTANKLDDKMEVSITPRSKLEVPAYPLKDYKVAWTLHDKSQQIVDGGVEMLPTIMPDDPKWQTIINNVNDQNAVALKVALLDPQAYSVLDTTIYLAVPQTPEIKSIHSASKKIRIVFDRVPNAKYYKARYGEKSLNKETDLTINDFVEIEDLEYDKTYQVELVAVNESGESLPTDTQKVTTDEDELPPVIWETIADNNAFFVGYTVGNTDYLYELEYGTSPGDYTKKLILRNVGVLQVPDLQNGKTYYYRLRRKMQWGFASEWSPEIAVQPDGGISPVPPVIYGTIKKDNQLLVHFKPVNKATGYQIKLVHKITGVEKIIPIAASKSSYALLEIAEASQYQISMQSLNEHGGSEWAKTSLLKKIVRP